MIKYVKATNTGKGFITHEDQEIDLLSFNFKLVVYVVSGDSSKIDAWINRIGGREITENDALIEIKDSEILGLQNEISIKQADIVLLNNKLSILNI